MPLNSLWGGLLPSDTTLRDSLLTRVTGVSRRFFSRLINFYNGGLVSCCPVNQSYVNRSLLFSGFPPHLGHHRVLSEFPVPYSRFSLVICFIHSSVSPDLPVQPTPALGVFCLPLPGKTGPLGRRQGLLEEIRERWA